MRLELSTQTGTSQGELKRFTRANIRFVDTLGGECGQYGGRLERLSLRSVSTPMGQAEQIRSGDFEASFGADHSIDALLEIRQAQPLPMTISSIAPKLQVSA
jgi:hypothetical protein